MSPVSMDCFTWRKNRRCVISWIISETSSGKNFTRKEKDRWPSTGTSWSTIYAIHHNYLLRHIIVYNTTESIIIIIIIITTYYYNLKFITVYCYQVDPTVPNTTKLCLYPAKIMTKSGFSSQLTCVKKVRVLRYRLHIIIRQCICCENAKLIHFSSTSTT